MSLGVVKRVLTEQEGRGEATEAGERRSKGQVGGVVLAEQEE